MHTHTYTYTQIHIFTYTYVIHTQRAVQRDLKRTVSHALARDKQILAGRAAAGTNFQFFFCNFKNVILKM